jgi:hypothetical protein
VSEDLEESMIESSPSIAVATFRDVGSTLRNAHKNNMKNPIFILGLVVPEQLCIRGSSF